MSEEATYRLSRCCTFRCPCGRTLTKRYPWDVVVCQCSYVWGEDEEAVRRQRLERRR